MKTKIRSWVQTLRRPMCEGVFASVRNLSRFPESGRLLPEVRRQNLREIVMGNYRLIYRINNREIAVLTVRHFKQMLPIGEINYQPPQFGDDSSATAVDVRFSKYALTIAVAPPDLVTRAPTHFYFPDSISLMA